MEETPGHLYREEYRRVSLSCRDLWPARLISRVAKLHLRGVPLRRGEAEAQQRRFDLQPRVSYSALPMWSHRSFSFSRISHFDRWNEADGIEPGSPEFYSKQYYSRGAKCWNGPMRSVQVSARPRRVRSSQLTGMRSLSGPAAQRTLFYPCRSLRSASTSSQGRRRHCVCLQSTLRKRGTNCNALHGPRRIPYLKHNAMDLTSMDYWSKKTHERNRETRTKNLK